MSGVVTAGVVVAGAGVYGANKAAGAARAGADTAAAGQQRALDYQMEREEVPQQYRERAIRGLGEFYGAGGGYEQQDYDDAVNSYEDLINQYESLQLGGKSSHTMKKLRKEFEPQIAMAEHEMNQAKMMLDNAPQGGQSGQQQFIDDVQQSPFYQSMVDQGEDAVARGASYTGGVRSGGTSEALAQNSQNVLQGLVNQRLGGLTTMSRLPSNTNNIAAGMAGVGNTQAMGQVAVGQIEQQRIQGLGTAIGQGFQAWGNKPYQTPATGGQYGAINAPPPPPARITF